MRVLHVIETLAAHEGGPPRVVAGLTVAQRALGMDAHILCGDGAGLAANVRYWQEHEPGFPGAAVHSPEPAGESLLARRAALRAWLATHVREFDALHIHSLWRLVPTVSANAARLAAVPYLIAPHTALSPWALAQKRAKKLLARRLTWDRIFAGAHGFHALNDLEAAEIRATVGAGGPQVFVVPNGVSPEEFAHPPRSAPGSLARAPLSAPEGGQPFLLFLARLHTMKGPDLLLEAFALIAPAHPQLQLVLAGPDFGMLAALRARAAELQLAGRVHFTGMVSGEERLWLLSQALCLAQPSRDEGFSLSILEGLASGRPVVISDRCKFPEVATAGAGLVVPGTVPAIASALRQYVDDPARRHEDGARARGLIASRYTWAAVARHTQAMYGP
jgi:glycosyltransferase involved in cell wall biosynthesis